LQQLAAAVAQAPLAHDNQPAPVGSGCAHTQVADAPPAGAAALRSSVNTKVLVDQRSSMRDTCTESDSPRKVAATAAAAPAAVAAKEAPPSIWERLASHEVGEGVRACVGPAALQVVSAGWCRQAGRVSRLFSCPPPQSAVCVLQPTRVLLVLLQIRSITPEVQAAPAAAPFTTPERAPAPSAMDKAAAGAPAAAATAVVGGASPASASLQHPKPWGARSARSSGGAPVSPASPAAPGRRNSSGGGATPSSLLKPTAASAARAQATQRPKNDDLASWRH
jgi:hypothetical protein